MKAEIKNGQLIITMQLQEPTPSKSSGKTLIVATSRGIQPTALQLQGKTVMIGVNAFIKPE